MTPDPNHHSAKESAQIVAWAQTRLVLRIIVILLAVAAFLWIIYKLTTVLLLVVLSVFFAYLVAPLVAPGNAWSHLIKVTPRHQMNHEISESSANSTERPSQPETFFRDRGSNNLQQRLATSGPVTK